MVRLAEGGRYLDEELNIPYPWYTRPCLEWLQSIKLKGKKVFEYGVGDSTKWYEANGAICWGVDDTEVWARYAEATHQETKEGYLLAINHICILKQKFDIVCIDGVHRDECTEAALRRIKKGGYLIIDNYKQPSVQEHWPLTEVLITGMDVTIYKEEGHPDWQTAVIHIL